jgi:hypothetical protein
MRQVTRVNIWLRFDMEKHRWDPEMIKETILLCRIGNTLVQGTRSFRLVAAFLRTLCFTSQCIVVLRQIEQLGTCVRESELSEPKSL